MTTPEESLKIFSVFIILISSFVGISFPIWLVRIDNVRVKSAFDLLRCISIGLILGVTLLHMLPEANEMLGEAEVSEGHTAHEDHEEDESGGHGHAHAYPYSLLFASLGVCLMLFLEQVAVHLTEQAPRADDEKSDVEAQSPTEAPHCHHDATLSLVNSKEYMMKAYVIELSIALHSILIGIGLGVLTNFHDIEILLIALCFHQLFEGIGLGGAVVNSKQSKWFLAGLVFSFSFSCPMGVALGAGIAHSFDPNDVGWLWTQGVLYSIACGTLLYIGLYDLMVDSFQKTILGKRKFGMVFAVGLGIAAMAILALWA